MMIRIVPISISISAGNFAREFCHEDNADLVSDPLPDCDEKTTWKRLMVLWRSMRRIHKSNSDPTVPEIDLFKVMAEEFQQKLYSFTWVNPANQVHRLSHLAYFMQAREVKSIGAFSLEGLEHGNFLTKNFENTKVYKGDSKVGNKQLFRLLRLKGSPTLKRAVKSLGAVKRKPFKCSRCNNVGHKKNMKACPLFNQEEADLGDTTGESEEEVELESVNTETEEDTEGEHDEGETELDESEEELDENDEIDLDFGKGNDAEDDDGFGDNECEVS